jgi:hypothetical protein
MKMVIRGTGDQSLHISTPKRSRSLVPRLPEPISEGLRTAAITTGKTFAFPLVLTILVGLFLLIQHVLDRWDPRLTRSPLNSRDQFVEFE